MTSIDVISWPFTYRHDDGPTEILWAYGPDNDPNYAHDYLVRRGFNNGSLQLANDAIRSVA